MYWLPAILILPYSLLLLFIYRSLVNIKPFIASGTSEIFVSVVVACRNEEKNMASLLENLAQQNYPENLFEVLIVDDKSSDRTPWISSSFNRITNLKTLKNKGVGKKQALRTGILAAGGSLIITTDADCRMGKDWIRTIASFFELNKPDLIISPVKLEETPGFFGIFQELEFMSLQGITAGSAMSGNAALCNGANLAFSRNKYLQHSEQLHDEINSGDDIFLLQSLKKEKSTKILWLESNDALVTTGSSSSLLAFIKQRSRWISKSKAYSDRYTIILGIITFIAILSQILASIGFVLYRGVFWPFLLIIILKSVPDFLILKHTTTRHGNTNLMKWFLPVQLLYPFYVIIVFFYSLINGENRNINSPFPKET